ncbi:MULTISPECIES: hypothetical protein [Nocardia]|uniref:hypothetical protein n=1 Tax=Nocardia TaxID=1817 RepID=UPI0007EA9990|nr:MULTISPECIES: hypothetical protein [Nocardia]MBF6274117.1 hypothetical protein [Nocardia nova]OBA46443.1 hypothetical protein A5789_04785 [Nocardia sp. 852002-51101_SCH5132738]OBB39068.1 hypothetical protein A5748_35315 [Nocardia sp. 852002-51244_SCH5132740]OBF86694.1 hypothetical protein A9X06_12170 [Mycobacterium sp. 852002-51759_SCH5129042]
MSGAQVVFGAGELAVLVLAVVSLVAGVGLARGYRLAGWSLAGAAVLWLVAEGLRLLQFEALLPALAGPDHESARMLVGLLGDAVYFGLSGVAVLLLFFAAVVERASRGDGRREPVAVARRVGAQIRHYYRARDQRERSRRGGR